MGKLITKAQFHAKNGETLKAKELYELILKDFPKNKRARLGIAGLVSKSKHIEGSQIHQSTFKDLVNLYSKKQFHNVVDKIKNLLSSYPPDAIPWEIFGAAAAQIGDINQAIFAFKNGIAIEPKNPGLHYNLGTAYKQYGDLDSAIVAFSAAIDLKPNHILALNNIGTVFKEKFMLDEAIAAYQKVILIDPNHALAYNNLGVAFAEKEQFDDAIIAYKQAITLQSNYSEAYYNLAYALHKLNQLEASIEASKNALAIKYDFPEVMLNMGNVLHEQGKSEEALDWLQKALIISPSNAAVYFNMGNIQCDNQMLSAAVTSYKQALQLNPNYTVAHYNLGRAYMLQNMFDEALVAFFQAIKLQPDHLEAHVSAGNSLRELGKFDDAVKYYHLAQELDPDHASTYFNHGVVMHLIGNLDAAINLYQETTLHDPKHTEAYYSQALVLMDQGKYSETILSLEKLFLLNSEHADGYRLQGNAFLALNNPEEAIVAYKSALALDPMKAEIYEMLGVALNDVGLFDDAFAAYMDALAIEPNSELARNNLGKIHWLRKNFKRAFELMESRWVSQGKLIGQKFESNKSSWNGEHGKDVFVWKEQGIGDQIMFSSILSELNEKSKKLTVECDERLIPLYERSFSKKIRFIDDRNKMTETNYDSDIAIGSLPKHFRHNLEDFKCVSEGWLKADPERTRDLRQKLLTDGTNKLIGISWFTNSAGGRSQLRSIPLDMLMGSLTEIDATIVSLQYGDASEERQIEINRDGKSLVKMSKIDTFDDIDGLAALISACDHVISIDNTTVHLAGALGKDTRVLLPAVKDVRWGESGRESYLYDSVVLYRQIMQGEWADQLDQLINDLKQ